MSHLITVVIYIYITLIFDIDIYVYYVDRPTQAEYILPALVDPT